MSHPNQGYGGGYGQNYQGYPPQQGYPQQQGGYAPPPAPSYGDPNQAQQYPGYGAPPQQGGFQHYQQGYQPQSGYQQPQPGYDQRGYDPNNPQQQQQAGYGQFPQQHGAYDQPPYAAGQQQGPVDPNAPEGERGLLGAIGGGYGAHKMGSGMLGTIAGAFLGSKAEDKLKQSKYGHGHGRH